MFMVGAGIGHIGGVNGSCLRCPSTRQVEQEPIGIRGSTAYPERTERALSYINRSKQKKVLGNLMNRTTAQENELEQTVSMISV